MADPFDLSMNLGPEFTVSVVDTSQGDEPFSISVINTMQPTVLVVQSDPGLSISIANPLPPVAEILIISEPILLELKPANETFSISAGVKSSGSLLGGGNSSPTLDVEIMAAQAVGLFRAVTILGVYCIPTQESLSKYAGVTKTSAVIGSVIKVAKSGLLTEGTWNWIVDSPIFIGANGILTQTATALPVRRIGYAVSATQINLDPFPIIGA